TQRRCRRGWRARRTNSSRSTFRIKQISYSVGFKTPAHFSTAFKKRHEMTPSEYRASNTGCN
ncbi:helix-turn-helix domain-containing protein, partial [Parasutterella excrementihominis]|uniref:helix-turn-helix domain-containing protein n=1 Tax=Parasutterella excrementihominis TaxID=487175 RepID=UPI003AB45688